jgi:hypothetical protein
MMKDVDQVDGLGFCPFEEIRRNTLDLVP